MRIESFITKDDQRVELGKFTVLVGPNNVGKSQTLRDIYMRMYGTGDVPTIVSSIKLERPARFEDLFKGLKVEPDPNSINQHVVTGVQLQSSVPGGDRIAFFPDALRQQYESSPDVSFIMGNLSKFRVSFLDASSRLAVAQTTASYNPHIQPPQSLLQGLFGDASGVEQQLQEVFWATFRMNIKLDYSSMQHLTLRIAREFEVIPDDPRKAYPLMSKYGSLDTQGDGFRSFVGVVLSLLLSAGRTILLDEPEAFLHPAQARALGGWLAQHVQEVSSQLIVSTHNANFLTGILLQNPEVDIYRLNRTDNQTKFSRISAEATSKLATSPLLSSQRVMESIFHTGVVVCEADSDRTVYQAVAAQEFRSQNVLFMHSHNKQATKDVVELLQGAQIPVCAITDIDLLNSKDEFAKLLNALDKDMELSGLLERQSRLATSIEGTTEDSVLAHLVSNLSELVTQIENGDHNLAGARGAINRIRGEASKWDEVKKKGLDALDAVQKENAKALLNDAANHGLFIVPVGELEGWLDVGTRQKNKWVVPALTAIHAGHSSEGLIAFVRRVLEFMGESIAGAGPEYIQEQLTPSEFPTGEGVEG